ncbi:acetyl-CoA C-acetyltransferase [Amphibacillus sp. Q70]|uniref:acetyl-CoA C-acetyltransferase n=1 Tax=Amphibacillus sp. Q70 TaxID=3453416 RepID=UPI003F87AFA3
MGMREVVVVQALRTPIGSFLGAFNNVSAVELGTTVVKEAMSSISLAPSEVDELIFGNVLSAGLGQNVARQVLVNSDIPKTTPAFTVNKVCGSGLKTVTLAAQSILVGDNDVVIAGGTENMSQSPHVLMESRKGKKMGNAELVDSMLSDGLMDAFNNYHMGVTAENIAKKYNFSREEQDKLATMSQNRAEKAIKDGKFKNEIVPITVPQRKGNPIIVDTDEFPRAGMTVELLSDLKPVFEKNGTVTAGNSSGINDGAAVLILMSREKAEALGMEILVTLKGYASGGVEPEVMGTGPIPATKNVLRKTGYAVKDIDLIEANEAFASQALSVIRELNFNTDIVNVNGGAIALGHPIGASGTRILVTLIHEMQKQKAQRGLATLCIGGGQGVAVVVERES